jgi:hypothetical protein
MIFILEGENKTGKTTLSGKLVNEYGFKYKKFSQPKNDPYIEYLEFIYNIRKNWVIDRFLWGELVYGPIYRGKSGISPDQFRNVEMLLQAKNSVVIYCDDLPDNIAGRYISDHEEWAVTSKIKSVLKEYTMVMSNSILPIYYHRIKTNIDMTKNNLLNDIIKEYSSRRSSNLSGTIIGNINSPKLLIVGNQRNNNHKFKFNQKYHSVKLPFDFGSSSKCLYHVLEKAKIPLQDVCITNAVDGGSLRKKIKLVNPRKIIALGNTASIELNNIPHIKLNHPSFEKRFYNISSEYVNKFREIYDSLN